MTTFNIKELMVPLSEYSTVCEDATLAEAICALTASRSKFNATQHEERYPHMAVLVFNKENKIVGKVSPLDVIKALEPKYPQPAVRKHVSRFGFNEKYLQSMHEKYLHFDATLEHVCRRIGKHKVTKYMYMPSEEELIDENASLGEALQRLEIRRRPSLLVTRKGEIVGILKLSDVFAQICDLIVKCNED